MKKSNRAGGTKVKHAPGFLLGVLLTLSPNVALGTPLQTIGTFCSTFPDQCRKGTESLMAVRGLGTDAYYVLEADVTSGALPVNVTGGTITATFASVGTTGAAVPGSADYQGLNNAGNLIGAIGDSSGRAIVAGGGTAGSAAGGVLTVQGVASMTPMLATGTGTAGTAATGVLTVQGITSMTPLLVNGSGSTQPVSGTVTANQGGAPWSVTGSGTAGTAAAGVITVQGITSMTPLLVNGSGSTQPVSGTVTDSNFPATVDTNTGAATASTIRTTPAGQPITSSVIANNLYSSTNVTTAAYVQLIASTANAVNTMCVSDSSGSIMIIATGGAGVEVNRLYLPGGGSGCFNVNVAASTRISLKALDATASSGYFLFTGY